MRWKAQTLDVQAEGALPGLGSLAGLVRKVQTPEFAGVTFYEVASKSALNRTSPHAFFPFSWTINPYRGCTHACVYCFARASHRYLDLDTGVGFDTEIVVKTTVVEVLRRELSRPSWAREQVAIGTNTDPYQRAEGRYQLMPGIISALAESGTGFHLLTKGTLVRRDLPLLARASLAVDVGLALSVAVLDEDLQRAIEPGAPSAAARLATVRAAADAGLAPDVFLMPVLPHLTDSAERLEEALVRIQAAGARSVSWSVLNLAPHVKEWYAAWLREHRPALLPRYRALFGDAAYATADYHRTVAARIEPLIARLGLEPQRREPLRTQALERELATLF